MARPVGISMTPEARDRISAGVRKALSEGRGNRRSLPEDLQEMFTDLCRKLGSRSEARRLTMEHAEVVARREKRA